MRGWRPVWLGAVLGSLLGFAGGAGAGLLQDQAQTVAARAIIVRVPTPTPPPTPAPTPTPEVTPPAGRLSRGFGTGPAQPSPTCGKPGARLVRFRVLVEHGLETTPEQFAKGILSVLCDRRSWIGSGRVRFRYDPRGPLLIGLRTPDSAERRCLKLIGRSVGRYFSCAGVAEVVLNSDRWFSGSRYWPGPLAEYRRLLVNHEVGHVIGQRHRSCPRDGALAPVMMQQSKGLTTDGRTCRPNPWPLASELAALRG